MTKSSDNLQRLLKEVDTRKKELDALQPIRQEDAERLWKKLRLEWNYNSNHIEGNTLTYQETELVLIFDQAPNGSHTVREIEEMKAHDVAVALVRDWAKDEKRELSEADIRDLNRILLVRPFWKEALTPDGQPTRRLIKIGDYKDHPNSVRLPNGEMFHYASPGETKIKMPELVEWYRQSSKEQHPAVVAARLHYDFVLIHPFDDGNGRVSRLLMNYHLLRSGFPSVVIKSADKNNYLAALQRADVGDFESFAAYIAKQLLWSLDLSIRAAKGLDIEEPDDWEKEIWILTRENSMSDPLLSKSSDILQKRYRDSILPFISKLKIKLSRIDPLFHQAEIVEDYQGTESMKEFYPKDINIYFELADSDLENLLDLKELSWRFLWKGYRYNELNTFNIDLQITIWLKEYQYRIFSPNFSNMPDIEKSYKDPITNSEINDLVSKIGKQLTLYIKRMTDR